MIETKVNETYVPIDKATFLIRNGLGQDLSRLTWYLQALQNPQATVKQIAFRDYVGELLNSLTSFIFNDQVAYSRLVQYLLSQNHPSSMRSIQPRAFESLMHKAEDHSIAIEVLLEVYNRGYNDPNKSRHLTREQQAFNRVNSYCNGGKARKMDEDLDKNKPENREEGSTSSVEIYKNDTPGQTLKTIKRVVKANE